jgi:competence protein ComEA
MIAWIRELLAEFSPRALKASITVLAVVAFGTYVFSSSHGKDESLTIAKSPTASDVPKDIKSPKIFVHVAGSVKSPGIYKLDSGTRVYDAVLAAGGFTAKANQASVNMARALNDGEQLLVSSQQVGGQTIESPMSSSLISLNQASATQLEELPGVGPALAGRMIDWRTANGGFKAKEDLLNVAGIGDKLFASVKDLVTL